MTRFDVYDKFNNGLADVAQVVAHLIGSEEVTGPSPVISWLKPLNIQGFFSIYLFFPSAGNGTALPFLSKVNKRFLAGSELRLPFFSPTAPPYYIVSLGWGVL